MYCRKETRLHEANLDFFPDGDTSSSEASFSGDSESSDEEVLVSRTKATRQRPSDDYNEGDDFNDDDDDEDEDDEPEEADHAADGANEAERKRQLEESEAERAYVLLKKKCFRITGETDEADREEESVADGRTEQEHLPPSPGSSIAEPEPQAAPAVRRSPRNSKTPSQELGDGDMPKTKRSSGKTKRSGVKGGKSSGRSGVKKSPAIAKASAKAGKAAKKRGVSKKVQVERLKKALLRIQDQVQKLA